MPNNILLLNGSPKKNGNTAQLVEWCAKGARAKGARVEVVRAADLRSASNGCVSCRLCQKRKAYECVIKDDAQKVLRKMATADAIVFATPLYFYGPSAQLKLIIDRMFSLYKWDNKTNTFTSPLRGKVMGLIVSAYEGIGLRDVEKSFKLIADYSEMRFKSLLIAHARESGEIRHLEGAEKRAADFGKAVTGLLVG